MKSKLADSLTEHMFFDVTKELHKKIKIHCVKNGITVRIFLTTLIEKEFKNERNTKPASCESKSGK